jgi:hypothetical protein
VDVVAPEATLIDVTPEPPAAVWNTHVAPLALTSNSTENPVGLVDSVSVYTSDDTVLINNVPPIAPPVTVGCALCTAKPEEAVVIEESTLPTAVTVDELLAAVHST